MVRTNMSTVIWELSWMLTMARSPTWMLQTRGTRKTTVLLRERKRHTDRGVSSTPSAVLYCGGGGGYPTSDTPHPDLARGRGVPHPGGYPIPAGGYPTSGTPILTWPGGGTPSLPGVPHLGYPPSDLTGVSPFRPGQGTPIRPGWGTPHWTWLEYPPSDLAGVPPHQTWLGYPPSGPGWGTPLGVDRQTDTC